MNPKQERLQAVQDFCILVVAAWIIVPLLYVARDFRYLVVAALAIWLFVQSVINPRNLLTFDGIKILIFAATGIVAMGAYVEGGLQQARSELPLAITLILVIIGCQQSMRSKYGFYWAAIAIFGFFIFVAITTMNKLADQAGAARLVAKNSEQAGELMNENVGGYLLVYFASAMCPILLFLSLKLKFNEYKFILLRIVSAATFLVAALLVSRAGYGIAVLATMLCCLIVAVPGKINKPQFWLAFTFVGLILFLLQEPIFDQAKLMTKGGPLFNKVLAVEELSNFTGISDENSQARIERYARSINAFLDSPVIGTLSKASTGKHSTLLDMFARFGAIGGFILFGALFLPLYRMYQNVAPANKKLVISLAICLFIHAGLNNLSPGSTLAVFILMPFAISVIQQSNQQSTNAYETIPN